MILSIISDRIAHRFLFAFGGVCMAVAGYAILIVVHHDTPLQYGALFLVASGTCTAMPVVLFWFSMNGKLLTMLYCHISLTSAAL